MDGCLVPGCDRDAKQRGLCSRCYQRHWKQGTLDLVACESRYETPSALAAARRLCRSLDGEVLVRYLGFPSGGPGSGTFGLLAAVFRSADGDPEVKRRLRERFGIEV